MFADSFLPNLALFVLGQAAAWFYLRTGRFLIGAIATAALWIAADWAAVARFAFENDTHYHAALLAMQGTAVGITMLLAYQQWRRRWSSASRRRDERFAEGMAAYLRNDHEAARSAFRRLVATDPWDAAAWLALGNVCRRAGEVGAARRCYRRGQRVDKRGEYTELVGQLAGRASPAQPTPSSEKGARPMPAAKQPVEKKAIETRFPKKPVDKKPVEKPPVGQQSALKKPAEKKPSEKKPGEKESAEKNLAENGADTRPPEKPAQRQPVQTRSVQSKPPEPTAAQPKPAQPKPAQPKPAQPKPAQSAQAKPVGSQPAEQRSAAKKSAPKKSAPKKPVPKKPARTKPAPEKPAATQPAATNANAKRSAAKDRKRRPGKSTSPRSDGRSRSA